MRLRKEKQNRLEEERMDYPPVIFMINDPDSIEDEEDHLVTEGRNPVFCETVEEVCVVGLTRD